MPARGWVAGEPAAASRITSARVLRGTAVAQGTRLAAAIDTPGAPSAVEASPVAAWARGLLAALTVVAVVASGAARPARADSNVGIFFGQGCFWHLQHEFVKQEEADLGRKGDQITSLVGYAGGKEVGKDGNVCYHNFVMAPDYGQMGHTEVVNVSVPESQVGKFAKEYLDAAVSYPFFRKDPQDRGPEYRSAIGLPGGMEGPLFEQVKVANAGRMQLVKGQGNEPDTVGSKKIWIYDSNQFPFHQGEVYHQFHDDMFERYPGQYHDLKGVMLNAGILKKVGCPEMGL